ncbi:hypothetical protein AVEN_104309-1 [Araneus ventricosus]|uniref:Uncharacterized protein n=1 Tax=Araneus ventricosus TaxID=182803 RepID=A0A4Y2BX63_ARAVE|nr:hypothetical protein AVEN_104309-1 [Araneus ventricosus]
MKAKVYEILVDSNENLVSSISEANKRSEICPGSSRNFEIPCYMPTHICVRASGQTSRHLLRHVHVVNSITREEYIGGGAMLCDSDWSTSISQTFLGIVLTHPVEEFKINENVRNAFCVYQNMQITTRWMAELSKKISAFQAELLALHPAVE